MATFAYSPLTHQDDIRVLTLHPSADSQRPLEGSISHIRLPSTARPSFPADPPPPRRTRALCDTFEELMQKSRRGAPSEDSGGTVWEWSLSEKCKKSVRRVIRGREMVLEYPVLAYQCARVDYAPLAYDALSYTWGDQARTREIAVDGARLAITANLHAALVGLRAAAALMRRIFAAAASVVVWLGDAAGAVGATLAMALDCSWSRGRRSLFEHGAEPVRGLAELFRRPWWRRIWIVQEVVAARELVVLLGPTVLPWRMLGRLCAEIQASEFLAHPLAPALHACGYQSGRTMPLASDPRDKLYALLGMASDPVQDVFVDLVRFMAVHRRSLDILASARLSASRGGAAPSWLPDWEGPDALRPLNSEEPGGHFYRASSHTEAVVDLASFPANLGARGAVVDTIDAFGSARWKGIAAENLNRTTMRLFERTIGSFGKGFDDFLDGRTRSQFAQRFSDAVARAVVGRRFFVTKNGRMGLGPPEILPRDRVAILMGCQVPLVLREVGDDADSMVVVGEAYVSGLMNGEAVADMLEKESGTRIIILK
ncbi:HET-domain-containing protein [Durotheca rogersii]|uniref:HET-domain-containing protein n=1 Tax=Durotheca rogersii TaxID=419775 RepID=UPI00221E92AF|nr:HET-domain-containing protein [Durotheca rogersii]KAI5867869.1 HET-domain-containing protein [Durotheca rogersii]